MIDLMIKEYPAKHSEYSVILQERERQRIAKEYSVRIQTKKNMTTVTFCFTVMPLMKVLHTHVCTYLLQSLSVVFHSKCSSRTLRRWRPARFPSTLRRQLKKLQSSTVTLTGSAWKRGELTLTETMNETTSHYYSKSTLVHHHERSFICWFHKGRTVRSC